MSPDAPDGASPQDRDFAALWSSDGETRSLASTAGSTGLPAELPFLFSPGQRFGPYLIVRPLGKGGMGQVYEAEEVESGRRIAMKILSRGLGDDEERERFLNEGQLAASLSHPNTVYVFGTTEVQGFPVIAMELAPGGTLKDLIVDGKPLSPAATVDAILQVVSGLDAAAALGILHRDIKPSNCFVDRDGRILVGDFGLSMTTRARDAQTVAVAGTIMGTPGFASPEQLRGEALDVRSDIYSVGATLYFLLTGRPPFEDKSIVTLITRVGSEVPPVVTLFRPDVPPRLAAVVARCLSRTPADRPADYKALAAALEPFRSAAVIPASPGRRLLAGLIDSYAASLPLIPLNVFLGVRLARLENTGDATWLGFPSFIVSLLYYAVAEGRFGCGVGKAMLRLRVVDDAQLPPGFRRAFLRALAFLAPAQVVTQGFGWVILRTLSAGTTPSSATLSVIGIGAVILSTLCLVMLFATARRSNGYRAVHDRVTATRVVLRPKSIEARETLRVQSRDDVGAISGDSRIGPYVVAAESLARLSTVAAPVTIDAYDDRLHRGVWIELLPAGTPALPAYRRDLGRPARARWLSGRRTAAECWDAYEAVEGGTFLEAIAQPQPWSRVRHWLADASREIADAIKDGSLPDLQVDRVWIGADDRLRLLDWPPPAVMAASRVPARGIAVADTDGVESKADTASAQRFLYALAAGALRGLPPEVAARTPPSTPIPRPARTLLLGLKDGTIESAAAVYTQASATLRDFAVFPRRLRLLQLAVSSIVPVAMTVAVFFAIQFQVRTQANDPEAYKLDVSLKQLVAFDKRGAALSDAQRERRDAIEVYVAEHFSDEAAQEKAAYAIAFSNVGSAKREYQMAERALANHPRRSPEQIRKANAVVADLAATNAKGLTQFNQPLVIWGVLGLIAGGAAAGVAVLGLIGAVLAGGGFTFRAFGASLVTRHGDDASRLRALLRTVVAWSPLVVWVVLVKYGPDAQHVDAAFALMYTLVPMVLLGGAVHAWLHPGRGIQDRIAGTWIVPR